MELKSKPSQVSPTRCSISQCRKPKRMETRRENVKRRGKEARGGLPGSSSGLAAASGFLEVHRELRDLPLG